MESIKRKIEVQKASERFSTQIDWLDSKHSFSFGPHFNPTNTHHGLLLVNNDDIIKPSNGFSTHPHRDMEIVTWVLSGELEHKDSVGNKGIIYPGLAQRMSAGRGIWHSEINPNKTKDVRLIQMWVLPDSENIDPSYEQLDINKDLSFNSLVPVASGRKHKGAIWIRQKDAVLWVVRLEPNKTINLPSAPYHHIYIAKGEVTLEEAGYLKEGDAARLTYAEELRITSNHTNAEILIWEMGKSSEKIL